MRDQLQQSWCLGAVLLTILLAAGAWAATVRLQPSQVTYVGAFKFPAGFGNYGGLGATWNPEGNGGAGTLVVQGAVFTDQAGEFTPPTPQPLGSITSYGNLPTATTVRAAISMSGGLYRGGGQVLMSSLGYYKSGSHPTKLCFSMFNYYNITNPQDNYIGCSNPLGQTPSPGGLWNAAPIDSRRVGGHVFQIPTSVATRWQHPTWDLCFGVSRDAGAFGGSMGPVLICGTPWSSGDTFVAGASMEGTSSPLPNKQQLIAYDDMGVQCPEQGVNCQLSGYIGADIWTGAQYITIGGTEALVFAGRKCNSSQSYYCPSRGWWCGPNPGGTNCTSGPIEPRMLFYDVDQIGQVAAGTLSYHDIQPYATLKLPEPIPLRTDPVYDNFGHMAYDSAHQRLYLIQRYVGPNNAEPIAHVLQLSGSGVPSAGDTLAPAAPTNLQVTTP
jgi:hypothetical protein